MKETSAKKKYVKQKPPQTRNLRRIMFTLDDETIERLEWIQTQVPEAGSMSAAARWAARIAERSLKNRGEVIWKIM